MLQKPSSSPRLIWWGRSDPSYSRNAVIRTALSRLGWTVVDYRPGLMDSLAIRNPGIELQDASLVWVPCFRQRDVMSAARFAQNRGIPLLFDPLISAYDKQVFERRKIAEGSARARRLKRWEQDRFRRTHLLIADTAAHARYYQNTFGIAEDRTALVPVGADGEFFSPQPSAEGLRADRRVHVLFYGSFISLQGPRVIVEAARRCDTVDWVMLGDGPLCAECEGLARGLKHVRFEPWLAFEKLPGRIGQADILLGVFSPSAKAGRVVPNKVYQAMACARPVITRSPLPGVFPWGDVVTPQQHGICTIEPGDPDALADAVRDLASDPQALLHAGDAARSTFEAHGSIERITEALDAVIRSALPGGLS